MKKNLFETIYLFVGLALGFFAFWMFHTLFPGWFDSAPPTLPEVVEAWRPKNMDTDLPHGDEGSEIRYGHLLVTRTFAYIGPQAEDSSKRYAGNSLTCSNCHLQAGTKIGSGSFIGVYNRFPQFRGRENKMGTLEERINGCMERSMAGQAMQENSREMQAIVAYMQWLSEGVPEEEAKRYKGYVRLSIPSYAADTAKGKVLYAQYCQQCHMEDGSGTAVAEAEEGIGGYIYPPLSGMDSYNDGAGMNRVITAAEFIKGNMPFGATYDAPLVTDEEAFHIAAYINTFPRPSKSNREADFPDKKLKPVSTPYGPWVDPFPAEQHKFGPFPPIIEYYKTEHDIVKTK